MDPEMLHFFVAETESSRARRSEEMRFVHYTVMRGWLRVCPCPIGLWERKNPHRTLLSVPRTDPVRTLMLFTGRSHLCDIYSSSKDAET